MKYLLFLFSVFCFAQQTKTDSLTIYYATAKYKLTKRQKENINLFFKKKDTASIMQIQIKSYTDFVGSNAANLKLSQKRSQSVFDYITNTINHIAINSQSFGELMSNHHPKQGIQADRKSIITILFKENDHKKHEFINKFDSLKPNDVFTLKNINFILGKDVLVKNSYPELKNLVLAMQQNPKTHIQIEGHVCCGSIKEVETQESTYQNHWLSERRAKKIYDYLISHDIDKSRLQYKGFGFTKPKIFPEENEKDEYQNRRIEVRIISQN